MQLPVGVTSNTNNTENMVGISKSELNSQKGESRKMKEDSTFTHRKRARLSTGKWFLTMLLAYIPFVNLASTIVFIFDKKYKERARWAKGTLPLVIISDIMVIVGYILIKSLTYTQIFDIVTMMK